MRGKVTFFSLCALCVLIGGAYIAQSFQVTDLNEKITTLQREKLGEEYKAKTIQESMQRLFGKDKKKQKDKNLPVWPAK
jgi:hypothetical protein